MRATCLVFSLVATLVTGLLPVRPTRSQASLALRPAGPVRPLGHQSVLRCSAVELDNAGGVESGGASGEGAVGATRAVYKFLRPHTIRGTVLASVTGVARALAEGSTFSWSLLPNAILGMVALLCGNAFIVGINQIYDVDIDRVNKPFLPVAAGELGTRAAWALVLSCGVIGPLIVQRLFSPMIFGLYMFGTTIGTLYSVPPFRLKRFPLAAGMIIACVRGFLLNFGVYYATCEALGRTLAWNPSVAFLARFMTVFAAIIAVTKDLPDIQGDKKYGIETFSTKLGVGPIAKGATVALLLNYVHAVATALLSGPGVFHRPFMIFGHVAAAIYLLSSFKKLDKDSMSSVKTYYKRIWDLFYLEYAMYPFI